MTDVNETHSGVTLSVLKELQQQYRVTASKALGQNFLIDPNISRKIEDVIEPGCKVLEIGPGIGSLTVPLARVSSFVHAIELDEHILVPLADVLSQFDVTNKVAVIHNDVMNVDLEKMCSESQIDTVIGNLPYNISAPLLANIARNAPSASLVVAMVQKEVGERLSAPLGTREVSSITYKVQFFMDVSIAFSVPRQSFIPQPRVDSVVIILKRRDSPAVDVAFEDVDNFFAMIDVAFGQRRKMLRKSLSTHFRERLSEIFLIAQVDPTLRPEQCTLENFAALFRAHQEMLPA